MNAVTCNRPGCGQQIIWTISPTGARLCVNARPATIYRLLDEEPDPTPHSHKVLTEYELYISHWLTCKNPPH